ncbi:FkbM family methyltransferase [Sorangium sp. So ce375]|uniref:FkbM family methyltransferase n=1 Tax=Sorangium sp. So ce375 TaxID=3133306 RepID=UPI003F5B82C8
MNNPNSQDWLQNLIHHLRSMKSYRHVVGVRGVAAAIRGKLTKTQTPLRIDRPNIKFPFYLRMPSTDVETFEQVFIQEDYAFDVRTAPTTIVDAGANIGLASLYFANRFPGSRIIAIEPEDGNFELLERNVAPYKNITPVHGALWHENKKINLVDPHLGEWGFMTQSADDAGEKLGETRHEVQGMTIDAIMKDHGIEHIDILKMDIEGAEREIFSGPSPWLGKVDALIVELHERMKPGCNRSFYRSTNGFEDEWWRGENVYLARRRGCLMPPRRHRALASFAHAISAEAQSASAQMRASTE